MSQIVIHESSDFVKTSSDDELNDLHLKDVNLYAKQMVRSKKEVDKRFINTYRIRNAYRRNLPIKFQGFDIDSNFDHPTSKRNKSIPMSLPTIPMLKTYTNKSRSIPKTEEARQYGDGSHTD